MSIDRTHFTLYHDPHFYAAFPALCRTVAGDIILAFRRGRDFRWITGEKISPDHSSFSKVDHLDARSHIALCRISQDLVVDPVLSLPTMDPEAADQDANLLALANGRLLLTGFLWYPLSPGYKDIMSHWPLQPHGDPEHTGVLYLPWGSYSRISDDRGATWQERVLLPAVPGAHDVVPGQRPLYGGALRGQAVELSTGDILCPTYYATPENGDRATGFVYHSNDHGESWSFHSFLHLPTDPGVHLVEPALCAFSDQHIIAFCRTGGLGDRLVTLQSFDAGRHWQNFMVHDVVGHPYHPLKLRDGRICLVYGYRHQPFGIRARVFEPDDLGKLGQINEIVIRDDGISADLGYPSAVELDDGRILVAYYFTDAAGIRHIAASTVQLTQI